MKSPWSATELCVIKADSDLKPCRPCVICTYCLIFLPCRRNLLSCNVRTLSAYVIKKSSIVSFLEQHCHGFIEENPNLIRWKRNKRIKEMRWRWTMKNSNVQIYGIVVGQKWVHYFLAVSLSFGPRSYGVSALNNLVMATGGTFWLSLSLCILLFLTNLTLLENL